MKPNIKKILMKAVETGEYPPGTTAQQLAEIKLKNNETALHHAAMNGFLPPNTSVTDLLSVQDDDGFTPLHWAATTGNFPPEISAADLRKAKSCDGWSALHEAAAHGHLPPTITIRDLAGVRDDEDISPLFVAADTGNLPNGTTALDLLADKIRPWGSSLNVLAKSQVALVLANTKADTESKILEIFEAVWHKNPKETRSWAERQLARLTAKSTEPWISKRQHGNFPGLPGGMRFKSRRRRW